MHQLALKLWKSQIKLSYFSGFCKNNLYLEDLIPIFVYAIQLEDEKYEFQLEFGFEFNIFPINFLKKCNYF